MKKQGSAAPRGRPFTANDPRANRKGRPRKIDGDVFEEIGKAAARGDLRKIGKLLAAARDSERTITLLPVESTTPEELAQVTANMRRLGMFPPGELDLVKLFDQDREKALALVPEYIARRRLGLLAADPARGWPELSL